MKDVQKKGEIEVSDSISLLISILIRYPELGSIKLDPEKNHLKFNFILSQPASIDKINIFKKDFIDSEKTFFWLNKIEDYYLNVNFKHVEGLTMIKVERDVKTLFQDEIALIVALFLKHFEESIIIEDNDSLLEEDMLMQEELIGHMLENLKEKWEEKPLIAYREEGRVLVFNK